MGLMFPWILKAEAIKRDIYLSTSFSSVSSLYFSLFPKGVIYNVSQRRLDKTPEELGIEKEITNYAKHNNLRDMF